MTKEKELVIIDLSARLPYRTMVKCITDYHHEFDEELSVIHIMNFYQFEVKPYLRPMSSMTEEEEQIRIIYERDIMSQGFGAVRIYMSRYIEWLDSKHFDWRTDGNGKTLIEKGLAIEAPEGMYK